MMDKKITNKLVEERTNLYIEENWNEIIADIDKRVEREVKNVIKDMFSTSNYRSGSRVSGYIEGEVSNIISKQIAEIEIDKDEIARLVQKRAMQQAKKAKLVID